MFLYGGIMAGYKRSEATVQKILDVSLKLFLEKGYEEIVLNMFGQGLDESTISKFTKLDIEKVKEITKKHLN